MSPGPLLPKPMLTCSGILSGKCRDCRTKCSSSHPCLLHRKGVNEGGRRRSKEEGRRKEYGRRA